jgi:hypothetical protein
MSCATGTLAISNGEVFTIFKMNLNQKTMFSVDADDGAKIATAHSRDRCVSFSSPTKYLRHFQDSGNSFLSEI